MTLRPHATPSSSYPQRPYGFTPSSFYSSQEERIDQTTNVSGSTANLTRLKRYICEIAESTAKHVPVDENQRTSERGPDLIHTEQYLTIEGLRRNLLKVEIENGKLKELNLVLEKNAARCGEISRYEKEVEFLSQQRNEFEKKCVMLEHELQTQFESHTNRYNALRELFAQLETQSAQDIELCDSRRLEIQRLESELEVWKDKAETYELQIKQSVKEFERAQEVESERSRYLVKERDDLKKKLNARQKEHQDEVEKLGAEKSQLLENIGAWQQQSQQNVAVEKKNKAFSESRERVEEELRSLRADKRAFTEMKQKQQELETSLAAAKQRLSELQSSSLTSSKYQYEFHQLQQKLAQWNEAAALVTKDLTGVEPTPSRLKSYLTNIEKRRDESRHEIQLLRDSSFSLSSQELKLRDELIQREAELKEEKLRRQAAEQETSLLIGQVRGQSNLLLRVKRIRTAMAEGDQEKEDNGEDAEDADEIQVAMVEQTNELMNQFSQEKDQFIQIIMNYQQRINQLNAEKHQLYQQRETSCVQFKRLEEEFNQTKSELSLAQKVVEDQKETIGNHTARIQRLEQSSTWQKIEALKRQISESERRYSASRVWFIKEFSTLKAAIKSLLGWCIRLDRNNAGDRLTITLIPAVTDNSMDDDTFILFSTDYNPPTAAAQTEAAVTEAMEEFIWRGFKFKDFEFTVGGRYTDHWDQRWSDQLSFRQSFPALLAVITLDEHNRQLKQASSLSSSLIRQASQQQQQEPHDDTA